MGSRFDDYHHLIRLGLTCLVAVAVFFGLRALFSPADFGLYGHYRAGAISEVAAQPGKYAGQQVCVDCHDDVGTARAAGRHRQLSCEGCHGPLNDHANDPTGVDASLPDGRVLCVRCHDQDPARPKSLPQVVVKEHAAADACTTCHTPHAPGNL